MTTGTQAAGGPERVVVALAGGPEGDDLVRRAARIASGAGGGDLLAVHVALGRGLTAGDPADLARQRSLVEELGGTYHLVVGTDVPRALLEFARTTAATQLVLGTSRRGRFAQLLAPGVGTTTASAAGALDVHLVPHQEAPHRGPSTPARAGERGLSARRRGAGFALAVVGLPLLTVLLLAVQEHISLPTDILAFLVTVVAVALVGGFAPALCAAVVAFFLLNYWFTQPLHQFTIASRENVLALLAFLLVAVAVSSVVDLAARRTREASRARAEAATLSTLAGSVLRGHRPLHALLQQLRETFGFDDVTLLERVRGPDGDEWRPTASVGRSAAGSPGDGDAQVRVDDTMTLVLRGHALDVDDRRVVEAFAAQAAVALRQERLAEQAARAAALAEVDRLRTALLNAVSHDLRTPLASATAAVSSLRSDVLFTAEDRAELLATAEESLDRLRALVENLLDMSRLQAGALALALQPIDMADVVAAAVDTVGPPAREVAIDVPDDLPDVLADPALLERAVANLVANSLRHGAPAGPPLVTAASRGGRVELRVVDTGPGVPREDWDRIFLPFQRLGDHDAGSGVGLGLALSRGLVEAMGGTLVPEATPGGGLTMVISLPQAPSPDARGTGARPAPALTREASR
jgi:two-component system sensor histidine kinase KdpD